MRPTTAFPFCEKRENISFCLLRKLGMPLSASPGPPGPLRFCIVFLRGPGETREAYKGIPVLRKRDIYFILPPSQNGNALVGLAGTAGATQILQSFSEGPQGNA